MRLVFVTQSVDAEDPILGATVAKLRALAQRCDELVVITDHIGRHDLPANCNLGRGLRYMRALVPQLLRRDRPDAVIAHMCPIYLVLAAPLAKLVRVPLALWYTHWTIDRTLKLATALADVGLSVDRRSYPIDDPKVLGIGHGIDVAQFAARNGIPESNGTLRLLGADGAKARLCGRLLQPDLRWHEPGRNLIAGDYAGCDEVVGHLFARLADIRLAAGTQPSHLVSPTFRGLADLQLEFDRA